MEKGVDRAQRPPGSSAGQFVTVRKSTQVRTPRKAAKYRPYKSKKILQTSVNNRLTYTDTCGILFTEPREPPHHYESEEKNMENSSRTYYYARVSSQDQNLSRQLEAFRAMGADDREIITDKKSGKDTDRAGYRALRDQLLRPGDTLIVKSLDRLSRNKADIRDDNIRVKVLDIPTTMIDFDDEQKSGAWVLDMVNNILIEVLSSMAEQERITIRQRQREGLDAMEKDEKGRRISAKKGTHAGRPDIQRPQNWDEVYKSWKGEKITAVEAMKVLGLKKSSFYKLLKEYESR